MAVRFEHSVEVAAAPESVFAYVSDFTKHADWSGHGLVVTPESDGPVAVGSAYATTAKQFGTQRERSVVTEVDAPKRFAWQSTGALGRVTHWFAVADRGAGATLTKGIEVSEPSFLARVMRFKLAKDAAKAVRADLDRIKSRLDG